MNRFLSPSRREAGYKARAVHYGLILVTCGGGRVVGVRGEDNELKEWRPHYQRLGD